MEKIKKTKIKDQNGRLIFPETSAEMVRETEERRFISDTDLSAIAPFGSKGEDEEYFSSYLVNNRTSIEALVNNEAKINTMAETTPSNLDDLVFTIEELSYLVGKREEVEEALSPGGWRKIRASESGNIYSLDIDDSDRENPKLVILPDITDIDSQPTSYKKGDIWTVKTTAPPVSFSIPISEVRTDTSKSVVFSLGQDYFEKGEKLSEDLVQDLINGVQNVSVEAKGDKLPQAIVLFDVENFLEKAFEKENLSDTIQDFTMKIYAKKEVGDTLSQIYFDKNLITPVREVGDTSEFQSITFQKLTWTTRITDNFVSSWLNNDLGKAGLAVYGREGGKINISRPSLKLTIENPYRGQVLEATRDMDKEFNILDWKPQSVSEEV